MWWKCEGCTTVFRKDSIGIPQAPCQCGQCRYTAIPEEEAMELTEQNRETACDNEISDERAMELAEKAEDLR